VTLSAASNVKIISGGDCDQATGVCRCFAGQQFTFTAQFSMTLTTQARYDVGFYIATDGDPNHDGAISGQCSETVSLVGNTSNFKNIDTGQDVCGDIDAAHNPLLVTSNQITMTCPAEGQQVVVPFCTTWRQPGSNETCDEPSDAFPGSPSKCNCGNLPINIFAAPVEFHVEKTAVPDKVAETGGSVAYTVTVTNDSKVADLTLTKLSDDKYGVITQTHAAGGGFLEVTATTCSVPQTLAPQGIYTCSFTGTVPSGNTGDTLTDTVTACGSNIANPEKCHTDTATVTYTDVLQAPTLTKAATVTACRIDVTYTVVVTNNPGSDPTPSALSLTTLSDNVYGDITQAHLASPGISEVVSTTCGVPQSIAPSGNYMCSFVGRITSCDISETDEVTGGATAEGASYTVKGSATVVVKVPTP
jgi:hypothetical protein